MNESRLAIVGATATGKSALAVEVAAGVDGLEIVSADAMLVYRGMDIGTAKPSPGEMRRIPHHLIDVCEPSDDYTVGRYQRDVATALESIEQRGAQSVLVGGTGLYVRAVTDSLTIPPQFLETRQALEAEPDTGALYGRLQTLDPLAASRIEPGNRRRIVRALEVTVGSGRPFSSFGPGLDSYASSSYRIVGVAFERAALDARIEARYETQLRAGFLEEVAALRSGPSPLSRTARQALGYRELLAHLDGVCSLDEAVATAKARTRRFARRQERWFRRDPRIRWIDGNSPRLADVVLAEFDQLDRTARV